MPARRGLARRRRLLRHRVQRPAAAGGPPGPRLRRRPVQFVVAFARACPCPCASAGTLGDPGRCGLRARGWGGSWGGASAGCDSASAARANFTGPERRREW
eukprot:1277629-Pyramimonas_sp.AAC.1